MVLPSLATMMTVPATVSPTLPQCGKSHTFHCYPATKRDISGNRQMVQLQYSRNAGNALLELGNLLEVASQLDEWSTVNAGRIHHQLSMLQRVEVALHEHEIRAGLDGQEASSRDVDSVSVLEMADSSADSSLQLNNGEIRVAGLIGRDDLSVGDNLQLKLVVLDNTLDGLQVQPDVVGVEVLELLDRLEVLDVLLRDLRNFEKADSSLIVNDGTTLDVSLGLVRKLHDVLGVRLAHVLQDAEIDDSAQVVNVAQEEVLLATADKLVKDTRVLQGLENVSVSGRIPVTDRGIVILWHREKRVLRNTGIPRLIEGEDINLVALVLLDDVLGILVGVERVHQNEWHVNAIDAVEVLNLAHGKIKERHAVTDFNHGLGANASHGCTETSVELQHSELRKELWVLALREALVRNDLRRLRWGNAVPFAEGVLE